MNLMICKYNVFILALVALFVLSLWFPGWSGAESGLFYSSLQVPANTTSTYTVEIININGITKYNPEILTIYSGSTVYWHNNQKESNSASASKWDTGILANGKISNPIVCYSVGTTHYSSKAKGSRLKGIIIVLPVPSSTGIWEIFSKEDIGKRHDARIILVSLPDYNPSSKSKDPVYPARFYDIPTHLTK
jgi:plastocyanin